MGNQAETMKGAARNHNLWFSHAFPRRADFGSFSLTLPPPPRPGANYKAHVRRIARRRHLGRCFTKHLDLEVESPREEGKSWRLRRKHYSYAVMQNTSYTGTGCTKF